MGRTICQFAPFIGDDEYAAIRGCFEQNWLTEGPKSERFLAELRRLMGVKHAVLAPNGTLALYLGLRALGIGPGDDVVVPDFTFLGSASAVEMTGATPVFCDVDPRTLQARAEDIERVLTPGVRAVMPVHAYGMTCEMDAILRLAADRDLLVIEDAAQGIGVRYKGRHAGTMGQIGCFSFFADKTITTGEGGLVATNDDDLYDSLCLLRNQGRRNRGSFIHPAMGYNFRLTDIQAAIGLAQLEKLPLIIERKTGILERYRQRLSTVPQVRFIEVTPGSTHVPFRVAIYAEQAGELMEFLKISGIEPRSFFYPLHRQPAFDYLKQDPLGAARMDDAGFPGAIYASENGVCLPSYPSLPPEDLDDVADAIRDFYDCG